MKLKKELGLLDVFCVASGAMISSGLFILPGLVYAKVGPAVILAYIIAGILILPVLFAKSELATAMPKAGGDYFFIERSMGSTAGTIGGFASWFSLSLKSAFSLLGIGVFATLINPSITEGQIKFIAVLCCIFFTVINLVSVKVAGRFQVLLVILLIVLLVVYIMRGFVSVDVHRYSPFMPYDKSALFGACGLVFISFGGLTKAASIAEEIKNPTKNIPYGMILAFVTVFFLYAAAIFVTVGLLDSGELAHSLTPISAGSYKLLGAAGSTAMALAAIFSFISTANAGILAASRFPMAMSRDQLLPDFFAKINKRFNTPHFSIIFTGLFMTATILFLDLEGLVKVASTMQIVLFLFVLIAGIVMRESRILNYKPAFTAPLYPWLYIAGMISYLFLLSSMGKLAILSTVGFLLISVLWHKLYVEGRSERKSALIHIVERISAKEIAGDSLNIELREILKQRDEIVADRFDKLVKKCELLDISKPITLMEFFSVVADRLAGRLGLDAEQLFDSFIMREKESTTVIRPGLAIPHVIIEGKHKFELLIARCTAGIDSEETLTPFYAAFVLIGSRDERNFHLRALSAIAQIAQDPDFDKIWLHAKNIEELRDIILLSKRRREKGL